MTASRIPSFCLMLVFGMAFGAAEAHAKKTPPPSVRWTAGAPCCKFGRGDDGRYRWTMSDKDLDITLIVDSQELTKSKRRFYHLFAVYATVTFKGAGSLEFPADLRLDFVRHHDVIQPGEDPGELHTRLQNDLDTFVFDSERQIKRKPESKEKKTAELREYQKEAAEFIEFVTTQYLEPTTLNAGNPEVHGWVFFSTKNKWIGPWKEREDFVVNVWMKDRIWQFPFSLPPNPGDLILRKPQE